MEPQPHAYPPPDAAMSPASPHFNEPLMPPTPIQHLQRESVHSSLYSAGARDSGWTSRASLQEERGLLPNANQYQPSSPHESSPNLAGAPLVADPHEHVYLGKSEYNAGLPAVAAEQQRKRRKWLIPTIVGLILLIAAIVVIAVYFAVIKPNNDKSSSGSGDGKGDDGGKDPSNPDSPSKPRVLVTGGDGSTVTMEDGTTFTYKNPHGGYWYYDPDAPTSGAGRANSWTPPVNESWPWGKQNIHGVNLGGWLVLEPFISPAPFEKYQGGSSPVVDEWTLSQAMAADTAGGGLNQLEDHYKTFITEKDFAEIAGAGLTWLRLPVPFWAIDKLPEEPYLEKVAWTYFLKAITWARKYGLRINLDLHTIPGSQNGWNHSGKLGTMNWLQGVMGVANAQRSLNYIRYYTEFISQPEITSVVPMFGVVNEPRNLLDIHNIKRFYYQVYTMIRKITGIGKGPFISFHTAFSDGAYNNWLPQADRIMIDKHPYIIFSRTPTNNAPESYAAEPCNSWGSWANGTSSLFGLNSAGEFSAAINDCGLWVNEVGKGAAYEDQFGPGSCDEWNNWDTWTDERKAGMKTFAMASMESAQNWFFWTWRIGESQAAGKVLTPMWSYKLGLENGWMPTDPRAVIGTCASLGYGYDSPWSGDYKPWQTSGQDAVLAPSTTEDYSWPPPTLVDQGDAAVLPTYTPTGELPKLPMPTGLKGSGWFNQQDTEGAYVPVQGCTYPDPWNANGVEIPAAC